jgi:pyridoxamine 5'-phosphate oxidase
MVGFDCLPNPPWKKIVVDILKRNLDGGHKSSLHLSFATVKLGPPPRPAVRTVVFRGFVGESRDNESERVSGGNPQAKSSLILISTDSLMNKVAELENSGGVFEASWSHTGTTHQIRFNGTAHIYRHNGPVEFPDEHLRRYIQTQGDWTWERERNRLWNSHRPSMRGSFRNPAPGTPLDAEKREKLKLVELDSEDDGPDAREAKKRFSLIVLEVLEIEILSLCTIPVRFLSYSLRPCLFL